MTKEKDLEEAVANIAALMTPEGKVDRLMELYDSAKEANGGASMTIYQDVSDLIERLESGAVDDTVDVS